MSTRDNKVVPIKSIDVSSYTVPTDFPESDGTLEWNSTTLVLVQVSAGDQKGLGYFGRMLGEGAVDVLQADATRCGGITGFLQVASLCAAYHFPLSAHTAPAILTSVVPLFLCAIWNIFTIMFALKACFSMA